MAVGKIPALLKSPPCMIHVCAAVSHLRATQQMQEAKIAKDAAPMVKELNRGTE